MERTGSGDASHNLRSSVGLSEEWASRSDDGGDDVVRASRHYRTTAKIRETQGRLSDVVAELGQKREMLHEAANEVRIRNTLPPPLFCIFCALQR